MLFPVDPSSETYLEDLYVYNFTLVEEFHLATSTYSASALEWMPVLSIDAVPAQYATVNAYFGTSREFLEEIPPEDPLRPERFSLTVNESTDLTFVVTGQNGMQRDYVI